jgi:hypothetical protein
MFGIPSPRRLAVALSPAIALGLLSLAACSANPLQSSQVPPRPLTAAEILQSATNVLNVHATRPTNSANSVTVNDLNFTMKFTMDINLSSSSTGTTGTTDAQSLSETATASGQETLNPRRTQANITMSIIGQALTISTIADYVTETGYVKVSGSTLLPGATSDKWYTMSYASLGGLGADTSMYTDYSKLKNAKLIGSGQINHVPVWHVRANEDLNQGLSSLTGGSSSSMSGTSVAVNATTDYYFRQDNFRPIKVVLSGTDDLSSLGTMTMTGEMDFTAFNTGLTITLPPASDVQPFPSLGA